MLKSFWPHFGLFNGLTFLCNGSFSLLPLIHKLNTVFIWRLFNPKEPLSFFIKVTLTNNIVIKVQINYLFIFRLSDYQFRD